MQITIAATKVDWQNPNNAEQVKYAVKDTTGKLWLTWSTPIGTATPGTTFDVEAYDKWNDYTKTNETYIKQVPKAGAGQSRFGGKSNYTPRNPAAEEAAKYPSFALSYAKDLAIARGDKIETQRVLEEAETLLDWLKSHAPAQQAQTTQSAPQSAPQAQPAAPAVNPAKPWEKYDSLADLNQNPSNDINLDEIPF